MNETKLKSLVRYLKGNDRRLILRTKIKGAWLSICGTTVSVIVLSATEFRYFFCARYNVSPLNFQSHCNRRGTAFGVKNALVCSTDSLVIACHNKIRDKLFYLSRRAFTSASVCAKPLIHQGRTISEPEICQGSDKEKETWGGVLLRGLWDCQVGAIIYVKLGDADADSYKYEPTAALLAQWETIKKDKHGKCCHYQRNISPFTLSVDGMLGKPWSYSRNWFESWHRKGKNPFRNYGGG